MKSFLMSFIAFSFGSILTFWGLRPSHGIVSSESSANEKETPQVVSAAQGRVEGLTEAVKVGAGIGGIIQEIAVKEGQQVERNSLIAILNCVDLDAEIESLEAEVSALHAAKGRLVRGARSEERAVAWQEVVAATAVAEQARSRFERLERLFRSGDVSQDSVEQARRDFSTADSALRTAIEREKLIHSDPLPEDLAKAESSIVAAMGRQKKMVSQREKCFVRSPIRGTVLRVLMRAGESYSTFSPQPIALVSDTRRQVIRAEVEERDIGSVYLGQLVMVSVEGRTHDLAGKVTHLAPQMGRKKTLAPDPAERSDQDIREALIELEDQSSGLPIGMRVVVRFLGK